MSELKSNDLDNLTHLLTADQSNVPREDLVAALASAYLSLNSQVPRFRIRRMAPGARQRRRVHVATRRLPPLKWDSTIHQSPVPDSSAPREMAG